jgi:spore germination protein YaaH
MERLRIAAAGLLCGIVIAVLLPLGPVAAASAPRPLRASQIAHRLDGQVYGFLPYWLATAATEKDLPMDLLSTISLFSVGLETNGRLDRGSAGYNFVTGSRATRIIRAAHAAGVRIDITFTSFGMASNRRLLRSASARARAASQIAALVRARGADGVTLDLEGLYLKDLPALRTFVGQVVRAVRAHNSAARVSVAVQPDGGGASAAKVALAGGASDAIIMGYDYRSASSATSGSIDPLVRPGGISLTWTLDVFRKAGLPASRLILALPYYGQRWPTTSQALHARPATYRYNTAPPYPIRVAHVSPPRGAQTGYDAVEATAWARWYDTSARTWIQVYWDTPRSLAAKYGLAKGRKLAGVGLWALGYDTGRSGYWQALATAFKPASGSKTTRSTSSGGGATGVGGSGLAMTSLRVTWSPSIRRWIVSYTARPDRARIDGYEVRYRVGSGAWHVVFYATRLTSLGLPVGHVSGLVVQVRAQDATGDWSRWASITG